MLYTFRYEHTLCPVLRHLAQKVSFPCYAAFKKTKLKVAKSRSGRQEMKMMLIGILSVKSIFTLTTGVLFHGYHF